MRSRLNNMRADMGQNVIKGDTFLGNYTRFFGYEVHTGLSNWLKDFLAHGIRQLFCSSKMPLVIDYRRFLMKKTCLVLECLKRIFLISSLSVFPISINICSTLPPEIYDFNIFYWSYVWWHSYQYVILNKITTKYFPFLICWFFRSNMLMRHNW